MGSIPVGDSEFFFVPCSCHVEHLIFIIFSRIKLYRPSWFCYPSLRQRFFFLVIDVMVNWQLLRQGIRWPVSHDHIAGWGVQLIEVMCVSFEADRWTSYSFLLNLSYLFCPGVWQDFVSGIFLGFESFVSSICLITSITISSMGLFSKNFKNQKINVELHF